MNGTLVNRQLLEKGATRELKSGDEIQLLNPRTPGAGAEAAPPKPPYVFLFQDLRPPPREPEPLQGALQDTSFVAAAHGGPSSAAAAVQPHQEYVIEGELGRGTFAVVKKVRHARTGARYAMKVMEKKKLQGHLRRASGQTLAGDALKSKVLSEARILKRMSHPGIIKFYDIFETDGPRGELCMVMEVRRPRPAPAPPLAPSSAPPHPAPLPLQLAEGGELFDDLVERGCFGEADARAIMEQLLRALHYLHSQARPRPPLPPASPPLSPRPAALRPPPPSAAAGDRPPRPQAREHPDREVAAAARQRAAAAAGGQDRRLRPRQADGRPEGDDAVRHAAVPRARGDRLARLARGLRFGVRPVESRRHPVRPPLRVHALRREARRARGGPPPSIFDQIQAGIYPEEHLAGEPWARVSAAAKHLVTKLLAVDPRRRCTVDQALGHPWMRGSSAAPVDADEDGDDDAIEEASSDEDEGRRPPHARQPGGKAGASSSGAMGGGGGGAAATPQAAEARSDADGTGVAARRAPRAAAAARAAAGVAAARLRVGPRVQAADRPARPPERERRPEARAPPGGRARPAGRRERARRAVLVMMSSL